MIAVGFIVWQTRQDSGSSGPAKTASGIKTIWCVPEAEVACRTANIEKVEILTPAAIEKRFNAAGTATDLGTDAVVAPDYWVLRWKRLFTVSAPLAETAVVAVQKDGSAKDCRGRLSCLVGLGPRFSIPSLTDSSAGLLTAALALKAAAVPASIDDTDPKTATAIDAVKQTLQGQTSPEMLNNLLTLPLLDAAVMTRAEFLTAKPAKAIASAVVPAGVLTLQVGTFAGTPTIDLRATLTTTLTANGWQPATTRLSSSDFAFINKTYDRLR